jgi:hypothetical protein
MVTLEMLFWLIAILGIAGLGLKAYQLFFQDKRLLGTIEVVEGKITKVNEKENIFPDNQKQSYFG